MSLISIIPFTNILVGFASFISIIMYLFNIYDSKNGWIIGVSGNRLFGIYFNFTKLMEKFQYYEKYILKNMEKIGIMKS